MPPHEPVTHDAAGAGFAHLLRVVSSFGVSDARARRNAALARSLSSKGACACPVPERPRRDARLTFPVTRVEGSGRTDAPRFVLAPVVYASFSFESGFLPLLEILEAPCPPALGLVMGTTADASGLDALEAHLAPLGDVVVVARAEPAHVRAAIVRSLWDSHGGSPDVRLSLPEEDLGGSPSASLEADGLPGTPLRDRWIPSFPSPGRVSWRRWRVTELCASDVARMQF